MCLNMSSLDIGNTDMPKAMLHSMPTAAILSQAMSKATNIALFCQRYRSVMAAMKADCAAMMMRK